MNQFSDLDFRNIDLDTLNIIFNLSQNQSYTNNNDDIYYLYNKYKNDCFNDIEINVYSSSLFYAFFNCVLNKIYVLGILDIKSKDILKLFYEINEKEKCKNNPLCFIFEGLIIFENSHIIGYNTICDGINLIQNKYPEHSIFLQRDFLFGANLFTKKIPNHFEDISENIENNNNVTNNLINDKNIEVIINHTNGNELFFLNFTVDIIYFLAFSENLMEIIKNQKNLNQFGIFWNIIIDKKKTSKETLDNFVYVINNLFKNYNNVTSLIISKQTFDEISDKSLYTTYRFVNMSEYIHITKKPIIQSDVDFDSLNRDLLDYYNTIKHEDISLFKIHNTPWRKICATLSFFSDKNLTSKFSKIFKIFLNYFYDKNKKSNWFIDQLCLTFTYTYLYNHLEPEKTIGTIYKHSKNLFNYCSHYKNKMIENFHKKIQNKTKPNTKINKTIYMYWNTGYKNAPNIVKKCIDSWVIKNPNYNIYVLDDNFLSSDNDLITFDKLEKYIHGFNIKKILIQGFSDIIRLYLLKHYGGFWIDATCFCVLPLDYWINEINNDFFAFTKPGTIKTHKEVFIERLVDTWFLYSNADTYIINQWFYKTCNFWSNENQTSNGKYHYFWVHILFNDLYDENIQFKTLYDEMMHITVYNAQYLEHRHHKHKYILDKLNDDVKKHIDQFKSPLYKLTWKFNDTIIKENNYHYKDSLLFYFFEKHFTNLQEL